MPLSLRPFLLRRSKLRPRFTRLWPGFGLFPWAGLLLVLGLVGCQTVAISTPASQTTPLVIPSQTLAPTVTSTLLPVGETQIPTALPSPTPNSTEFPHLCSPLAEHPLVELSAIVSSPYDPPPMGKDDRHQGVDFAYYNQGGRASILGEGVQAILAGRVVLAMADRLPYGNMVLLETPQSELPPGLADQLGIDLGESLYHLYAHFLDKPQVQTGDWVVCGQLLGQVGMSGYNIPVAHLHLETRIGPTAAEIGPMVFYDTQASQVEMDTYRLWRLSGTFRHFNPMVLFEDVSFLEEHQP